MPQQFGHLMNRERKKERNREDIHAHIGRHELFNPIERSLCLFSFLFCFLSVCDGPHRWFLGRPRVRYMRPTGWSATEDASCSIASLATYSIDNGNNVMISHSHLRSSSGFWLLLLASSSSGFFWLLLASGFFWFSHLFCLHDVERAIKVQDGGDSPLSTRFAAQTLGVTEQRQRTRPRLNNRVANDLRTYNTARGRSTKRNEGE